MPKNKADFQPSMFDGLAPVKPPLQFMTIASGSSGNATLVRAGTLSILVDAGIPRKGLRAALNSQNLGLADLNAIVVTHAHHDHTKHLQNVHNNTNGVPIFGSKPALKRLGKWADKFKNEIKPHGSVMVDHVRVTPMWLPHDEPGCFGFMFSCEGRNFAMATDFGRPTDDVCHFIRCAHAMLIETNYDYSMLKNGKYSLGLKKRIHGPKGHLSNEAAAQALAGFASDKLHTVCCAHLSRENNTPELAFRTISGALEKVGKADIKILVAPRSEPGPVVSV